MTKPRNAQQDHVSDAREPGHESRVDSGLDADSVYPADANVRPGRQPYTPPVLTRHGKVTDLTLGGSPTTLDLESDGSIGRFGTPKN